MRTTTSMFLAVALAASTACTTKSERYCELHADDLQHCAGGVDAGPTTCTTSSECTATPSTSVCDVGGTNTCVQCVAPGETTACGTATPVCGEDHACRGCTAHAECASSACLADGMCADAAQVAYVSATGSGTTCSRAMPCTEVAEALATLRPYLKLTGSTTEQVTITNRTVTVLADPGAQLTDTSNGILLRINGTSVVQIYDLEISGASGPNVPCISLQPGNTASLSLARVLIAGCSGPGISASGGTLALTQSTVSGNTGGGISAESGTTFAITNNFIFQNGSLNTAFGGLSVRPAVGSTLAFNTIVDNRASLSGSTIAGGVFCDGAADFPAAGNLIFRNTGGSAGSVQTFGNCSFAASYVAAGASPADNTPAFVRPNGAPFDFHLTPATPSSILDAATCTGLAVDHDGDPRSVGAACDVGADELMP